MNDVLRPGITVCDISASCVGVSEAQTLTENLIVQKDETDLELLLHRVAHARPPVHISGDAAWTSSHVEGRVPSVEACEPLVRLDTLCQFADDVLEASIHFSERLYLVREGEWQAEH